MSSATKPQVSFHMPWLYLGGYLVFFIGCMVSVLGAFSLAGGLNGGLPKDPLAGLAIIGVGVIAFAAGSFLMARAEQIRSCHFAGLIVCFLMTPLPSLAGLLINFLGNYLRKNASMPVQIALIGLGVALLVLAGNWGVDLFNGVASIPLAIG